jgi:hypothetical protein
MTHGQAIVMKPQNDSTLTLGLVFLVEAPLLIKTSRKFVLFLMWLVKEENIVIYAVSSRDCNNTSKDLDYWPM